MSAEPKPTDPKSKRVLIVDDDESVLNLLEILVRRDKFQVILAETAEEAIRRLAQPPVDCVLLDLMLPASSGLEVLRRLREGPKPAPPVIIVTAYASHPLFKEVQQDPNVVQVLHKPIQQEKLLDLLHRTLGTTV